MALMPRYRVAAACVGIAILLTAASAFGQSTQPAVSTAPAATQAVDPASLGQFAEMPKVCGLDAAQVAKVKAAAEA